MNSLRLSSFGIALLLAGCAVVPMGSPEEDAEAKTFQPSKNQGSLYIYRNENFGGAVPMTVNVNNRNVGQTGPKTYFKLTVPPGLYSVESVAENTSNVNVQVEANKNHFVWQEVKMGMWMARTQVQQVDEKEGKAGVLESKILATKVPSSEIRPLNARGLPAETGYGPSATTDKLRELQKLYDEKLISESEYQQKRKQLLEGL